MARMGGRRARPLRKETGRLTSGSFKRRGDLPPVGCHPPTAFKRFRSLFSSDDGKVIATATTRLYERRIALIPPDSEMGIVSLVTDANAQFLAGNLAVLCQERREFRAKQGK